MSELLKLSLSSPPPVNKVMHFTLHLAWVEDLLKTVKTSQDLEEEA